MEKNMTTKALQVHALLIRYYEGPFQHPQENDPLSEMIGAMLSHRTKNERTAEAFENMRELFPTWEEVRTADTEELVQSIYSVTFPGQKARRIQAALDIVKEVNADKELSLDFLKDMKGPEARKWLEQIPGVGAKTSAAVLNFSTLQLPALVVDTHHLRVAKRLGWIPEKAGIPKAEKIMTAFLPKDWDAQEMYDHHEALMYHGQRCCYPKNPECMRCPISDHCEYGQKVL
jgi:endonuclease-3